MPSFVEIVILLGVGVIAALVFLIVFARVMAKESAKCREDAERRGDDS